MATIDFDLDRKFAQAVKFYQNGQPAKARKIVSRLIKAAPNVPQFIHLAGFVELAMNSFAAAIDLLRRAEPYFPDDLNLKNALGSAYRLSGDAETAIVIFQDLVARRPGHSDSFLNLGNALSDAGQREQATQAYEAALAIDALLHDVRRNLIQDLIVLKKFDRARRHLEIVIEFDQGNLWALKRMAELSADQCDFTNAGRWYDRVLAIHNSDPDAILGIAMMDILSGRVDLGLSRIGEIDCQGDVERKKHLAATSIMYKNYIYGIGAAELRDAAQRFEHSFTYPARGHVKPARRNKSRRRKGIRIGILSKKFSGHPFVQFLAPVLDHLSEVEIEIDLFALHTAINPVFSDDIPNVCRHDLSAKSKQQRNDYMRSRELDVFITPTGMEEAENLEYFSNRIAPAHMAAFGIFMTTGHSIIDHFLADWFHVPAGQEINFTENVLRMPNSYICYRPPGYLPPVINRPKADGEGLTFGCFNNLAKISDPTISLWSEVLRETHGSKLLIKGGPLHDPRVKQHFWSRFSAHGISADRLILEGESPHKFLLESYQRIDLQLDPLAYSGGLTTLESLWMGVPVVTLPGDTFARRHSYSHLSVSGLMPFIASDKTDYIRIASTFPDIMKMAHLDRKAVSDAIKASPLSDGKAYAGHLSGLIRSLI